MALEENLFTTKIDIFVFNRIYLNHFSDDPSFKISDQKVFSNFLLEFSSKLFLRSNRPLQDLKNHFEKIISDKSNF